MNDDPSPFDQMLAAIRSEGGATKENLVLAALGYVTKSVDVLQETLPKGNTLPLIDQQVRAMHYVATDIAIAAARWAAKLALAGEDLTPWAEMTLQEAHELTHAQLSGMLKQIRASEPPPKQSDEA